MRAVLVSFESSASLADVVEPFTNYAWAMANVPGLISKTWIADGSTVGGFHIFVDQESADQYFESELYAGVLANPAFSNFEMRQFDVLDELSAITGSPQSLAFQTQS
jgi:hypothetical protein